MRRPWRRRLGSGGEVRNKSGLVSRDCRITCHRCLVISPIEFASRRNFVCVGDWSFFVSCALCCGLDFSGRHLPDTRDCNGGRAANIDGSPNGSSSRYPVAVGLPVGAIIRNECRERHTSQQRGGSAIHYGNGLAYRFSLFTTGHVGIVATKPVDVWTYSTGCGVVRDRSAFAGRIRGCFRDDACRLVP